MTPLISIEEVARLLSVSKITIRRKVSSGELPCIRLTKGEYRKLCAAAQKAGLSVSEYARKKLVGR